MRTVRISILLAAALLVVSTGCDFSPPYAFRAVSPPRGTTIAIAAVLPYRYWDELGLFDTWRECEEFRRAAVEAILEEQRVVPLVSSPGKRVVSRANYLRCVPVR